MNWLRPAIVLMAVAQAPPGGLIDVAESACIAWRHSNGESADHYLVETTTGGAGFFDFDNDGLLDVFLVTGGETPHSRNQKPPRCALYRCR